jgi:hypothetical protein
MNSFEGSFHHVSGVVVLYGFPHRDDVRGGKRIEEMKMAISKRTVLVSGVGATIALSTGALAQTTKGNAKSQEAGTIGEGEAYMIGHEGQRMHKSKVKVSTAQHEAAMKKGAREVKAGTVIYRQGGKLYMLQDSANEKASTHFQNQFDVDY